MISTADHISQNLLAFGMPSGWEWMALVVIGLLVFGRRLPEVGRSVGKSIVEFKKGIKGIEDEIDDESNRTQKRAPELKNDSPSESNSAMYEQENTAKDA
tara:strand:- start:856 stop:1155 length:300 start_codon:yes stop_codon:yes gene_type:complete